MNLKSSQPIIKLYFIFRLNIFETPSYHFRMIIIQLSRCLLIIYIGIKPTMFDINEECKLKPRSIFNESMYDNYLHKI